MSHLKTSLLITTLVAGMSGGLPALADGSNTYINGSLGIQDFDDDRLLKSDRLISIGLEQRYSGGWGAEIFWMGSFPSRDKGTSDVDLTQYGIDGLYYFKSDESNVHDAIQPYGTVGLGHANFKRTVRTDRETQLRAGLGLRMLLNDHWSAKADARLIYSKEASTIDNVLTVGLSYAFNDQTKKVPPADSDTDRDGVPNYADDCPTTPIGTKADGNGCAIDSDNDSVADYKDNCPNSPAAGLAVDENGCKFILTRTEEVVLETRTEEVVLETRAEEVVLETRAEEVALEIKFASNSAVITEQHFAEIEKAAIFLNKYSEVNTVIEGHTDDQGNDAFNTNLSKARAEAVMTVLIERFSIEADRVSALGYGEARPIESNDTEAGRLANRRVVAVMKAFNDQTKKVPPADSDNDGVIYLNDNCPTTPSGVQVDSTGCAFDTDKDGVPNHADNCPTTPVGTEVDGNGCAIDSDNDGVADFKDKCPNSSAAGLAVDENGCKFVLTGTEKVALEIKFAKNSAVITEQHFAEIEKAAIYLNKYSEVNTMIEGHTDDVGNDIYNTNLSKARAEAVMTVLIERFSIEADRVSTLGYGEARPIESNDTEAGRLANRRVVAVMNSVADYKDKCPNSPAAGLAVDENGCKFVLTRTEKVVLEIKFAKNSAVITEQHFAEIEKAAIFLNKYSEVNTVIEGHTDNRGNNVYNTNLSRARAEAVMTVLIERFSIEADRVSALGYGEARPIESNDTEAGRLANRRVVAMMNAFNDQTKKVPPADSDNDGVADYKDNCPNSSAAGLAVDENGCKFVLTRTEEVALEIKFASNSAVITEQHFAEIEKAAIFLNKYSEVNTVIEGHTDDQGNDAFNSNLSKARAEAVMTILIERFSIQADRVSALGYGEARPIKSNDTEAGRLANRRVVAVMKAQVPE
jgi:OOP family OmpA-OmpF porin